ncbi:ankyrin repeat-containing domain protein [Parachaetomium inaequale]|uniref:Ankyrin repeat-containing domain protein n=1 Tax=Parachaetomium inaequale TaxID=2588326 RepID=A0AAN6SM61_9PEZI|nr:ankyrin repeat-containing domain protein [Parachaetomium inaequale]
MGANDIARTATARGHPEPILGHSIVQASKIRRRSAPYALSCTCACHRVVTIRMPSLLRSILGLFWFHSTAFPLRACQRCCDGRCREQVPTLKVLYLLPPWLLHRAIYFVYLHAKSGPSMGLAIRTIVPINSNLLTSAASGHVDRVRYLFQTRQSTPNDIHTVSGETPLHFAIKYGQLDMCKVLIDAGADMYVEDHRGRAAIDVAWMEIMANCKDEKFLEELRTLFGDVDHFQLRRLGELHQAVCGFSERSVVEVINHSGATDVDAVDEEGKTALAWAVLRGDMQTVQLLLERGADPNICDSNGDSPLALCTHGREPLIMNSLVLAGAAFTGNLRNYNALHKAAFRQNNADFLRPLIRAFPGMIDSLSDSGETPLALATFRDNDVVACFLLDSGAQIDTVDDSGTTPIFDAVKYRSHRTLEMLIHKGARLEHRTGTGQSLLHHVAEWGDYQGVEILRRHASDMKIVDTGWRDSAGRTAMDVVERRASAPRGLVEGFRALISDLQKAGESSDDDDDEGVEDQDVFYDCRTFV